MVFDSINSTKWKACTQKNHNEMETWIERKIMAKEANLVQEEQ